LVSFSFSPLMPTFIKKRMLWISAAAIMLALGFLACQWILERGRALAILEKECAAGLQVQWRVPSWAEDQPYLARLWPGAYLGKVHIDYPMKDAAALGGLLCHFGRLETLSIGAGAADEIHHLLFHCGDQPHLKSLMIFNVEVDDRILPVLAKWHSIETLAMVPNDLTGERFPLMPKLRSIDMSYSRVSDKGLLQLVESPKLEVLKFSATSLTSSALVQAARSGKGHLRGLWLSEVYLKDGDTDKERDMVRETVKQIAPELQFGF
jgi:hypothetical protein